MTPFSATVVLAAVLALVSAQAPSPTPTSPYCPDMTTQPRNVTGDCNVKCTFSCDTQECTLTATSTHSSVTCDAPTAIDPFCPESLSNPGPSRTLPCSNNETCTYNCANSTHTGTCSLSYSHNNMRWNVNCDRILPNPTTGATNATTTTTGTGTTTTMVVTTTTTNANTTMVTTTTTAAATPTSTATTAAPTTTATTAPATVGPQVPFCRDAKFAPSSTTPCNSNQTCSYVCSSATHFAHCLLSFVTADNAWHVQCGSETAFTSAGATTTATATEEPTNNQLCPAGLSLVGNYTRCMASLPCIYTCANATTTAQCTMSYTASTQQWTVFCNTMPITTTTPSPTPAPRSPFCPSPIGTPSTTNLCSSTSTCSFMCYNFTHYANCTMAYSGQWSVQCGDITTVPSGWNMTTVTSTGSTTTTTTTATATTTASTTTGSQATATVTSVAPSTSATDNTAATTATSSSGDGSGTTTTTTSSSSGDGSDTTGDGTGSSASDGTGDSTSEETATTTATETDVAEETTTLDVGGASGLEAMLATTMLVVIASIAW